MIEHGSKEKHPLQIWTSLRPGDTVAITGPAREKYRDRDRGRSGYLDKDQLERAEDVPLPPPEYRADYRQSLMPDWGKSRHDLCISLGQQIRRSGSTAAPTSWSRVLHAVSNFDARTSMARRGSARIHRTRTPGEAERVIP